MNSPTIPVGMKPWAGGNSAPCDWNGGPVLLRNGSMSVNAQRWSVGYPNDLCNHPVGTDIIAYTPRADVADSQQHANTVADSGAGVRCQQSERERIIRVLAGVRFEDERGLYLIPTQCLEPAADAILATLRSGGEVREAPDYVADGWLLKQLHAWPSRVDPDRTTSPQALMDFAAVEIERLNAALAPAVGGE